MSDAHAGGGLELSRRVAARVVELAKRLEACRASYYAGQPQLSDAAYDALEDELRSLAPAHPVLARVGTSQLVEAWTKAAHEIPMGSLNKVTDEQALSDWLQRCDELLAKEGHGSMADDLFLSEKLDGISVELIYRDGLLSDGITRGDGHVGERITPNVVRMRGVPRRIGRSGRLSVRGEIILRLSDMRQHFADYSSPRNAAAGTARRLDGQDNEHLTVLCYDLEQDEPIHTELAKLALLRQLGFATPNTYHGDLAAVLAVYQRYAESRRRSLDYEIDGLVVRANALDVQLLLGEVNHRPRGAVAFKFASPSKISRVLAIHWDTGSTGRVTPVAEVEPIELVGATVRRASLHNAARVRVLGIAVGDEVLVSRRNDVIPYIEEVVAHHGEPAQPPRACSRCGQSLTADGEYLVCRNSDCRAIVEGRLRMWIDATGALEWGDKLVAALVASELVREPRDLYRLKVEDIAALDRHGAKSAQNAIDALHQCLPLTLPVFLAALGIEGFSTQTARLVVEAGLRTLGEVLGADQEKLAAIAGIGEVKAHHIVHGLRARATEIERLRQDGIEPVAPADAGPLAGKSICITGTHSRPRKELVRLIEQAGGRVLSGVTRELSYLLIADPSSTSGKAAKARRYGTELISEHDLFELVGG